MRRQHNFDDLLRWELQSTVAQRDNLVKIVFSGRPIRRIRIRDTFDKQRVADKRRSDGPMAGIVLSCVISCPR